MRTASPPGGREGILGSDRRFAILAGVTPAIVLLAALLAAGPARPAGRKPAKAAQAQETAPDVISLDVKDADIRDVLRTFAELEHFNLVVDPEVRGSVTVRLENVRWQDALEVILRSNGLGWVAEGNVVRAAPPAKLLSQP